MIVTLRSGAAAVGCAPEDRRAFPRAPVKVAGVPHARQDNNEPEIT
jgi:hypothetical protein